MTIISITMIIEVNQLLREQGLSYKVHLSDACGKQSMWIEALDGDVLAEPPAELYKAVEEYFSKQRIRLEYSPDKHTIWAAR